MAAFYIYHHPRFVFTKNDGHQTCTSPVLRCPFFSPQPFRLLEVSRNRAWRAIFGRRCQGIVIKTSWIKQTQSPGSRERGGASFNFTFITSRMRACVHVYAFVAGGASLDAQPFLLRCSPLESPVSLSRPSTATPLAIPCRYSKTYRVTSDIIPLIMIS